MTVTLPIVLDPAEVASGRSELDLNSGDITVNADGIDWGDAAIQAYMAQLGIGEVPVDYRLPNRVITIPLTIRPANFDTVRVQLQKKVALLQREGGWLKRDSGLYADIVNATLILPDTNTGVVHDFEAGVKLILEALPDFYGDEVTLTTHSETTLPEIIFTEAAVTGHHPARVSVIVDDDQSQNRLGLLWGFRCRHYSSASTARLAYQAEALTPLDAAAVTALTGASGGSAVRHGSLLKNWTGVLSTDISGTGSMTHTGTYRVWARVYTTSTTGVSLRLLYDVGDFTLPSENDPGTIPGSANYYLVDLGEIRLDRAAIGTHRWKGAVQAKGSLGGEDVWIDRLYFQPLDDGAGRLTAAPNADAGLASYSARDGFDQSAGALAGKLLTVGGTWSGAGDSDDFFVESTGHTAQRTATSDASTTSGRFGIAGTTAQTATVVQADFKFSAVPGFLAGTLVQGVLARYASTSAYVRAGLAISNTSTAGPRYSLSLASAGGGTGTGTQISALTIGNWYTIRLLIDASGQYMVWLFPQGSSPGEPSLIGQHSDFATGGALASGKTGIYDANNSPTPITRNYDNFAAWVPTSDAVLFAGQTAQLRHDGMIRLDAGGAAYGPISQVIGDLPRLPPSGLESRTVEVFLLGSRGDLDQLPDTGIDDISAQIKYRPSYLFRP